jgi:hypothetical protein
MPIEYLIGDATKPQCDGHKLIIHICNDVGAWGKGFVLSLSNRTLDPKLSYKRWYNSGGQKITAKSYATSEFGLGKNQYVNIGVDTVVVNMIAQEGIGPYRRLDYYALQQCIQGIHLYIFAASSAGKRDDISIHAPRIGCGLAGGRWKDIEPILLENLPPTTPIYIYDLPKGE